MLPDVGMVKYVHIQRVLKNTDVSTPIQGSSSVSDGYWIGVETSVFWTSICPPKKTLAGVVSREIVHDATQPLRSLQVF